MTSTLMKKLVIILGWIAVSSPFAVSQCNAPEELRTELTEKYAGWKVVTLGTLSKDDRDTWESMHPRQCPGILRGKFVDERESFAIALVQKQATRPTVREQVVLFEKQGAELRATVLVSPRELAIVNVLVKLPPGRYSSFDDSKKIKTTTDAIAVVQLEARALLLYWDGVQFKALPWSY